jgi:hypothetical protein
MPFDWGGMVFAQRWRHAVARGTVVGIRRPHDRTMLDVRVHGADLNVGSMRSAVGVELIDAGDIAREKRLAILDRVSVVIQARIDSEYPIEVLDSAVRSHPIGSGREGGGHRDPITTGTRLSGVVGESDGEGSFALDVGIPIVVTLPAGASAPAAGSGISLVVRDGLRGYLIAT